MRISLPPQPDEASRGRILRLIVVDRPSIARRVLVLVAAVLVFSAGHEIVTPWLRGLLLPAFEGLPRGPWLLLHHMFVASTPTGLMCLAMLFVLVRFGALRTPPFVAAPRESLKTGVAAGLLISAFTAIVWLMSGGAFQFEIDLWKMAGNLFSNASETIMYNALIFSAALYAMRRVLPAALFSGAVFGVTHAQFPPIFQIYVALVGTTFAVLYERSGSLLVPYIAHQVSDMVLDTFLKA